MRCLAVLLAAACACACSRSQARSATPSADIGQAIADPPECPPPPAMLTGKAALAWARRSSEVAHAAADSVARAMDRAEQQRDVIWLGCLTEKHRALVGLERRMAAERIALTGMSGERASARVRRACLRVHRVVFEARHCV